MKPIYRVYSATGGAVIVILITIFAFFAFMRAPVENNISETLESAKVPESGPFETDQPKKSVAESADIVFEGAAGDCNTSDNEYALDPKEQEMITKINEYRAQNGLGAVQASGTLTKTAAWMAKDMADNSYLSHTDSLGRDYKTRLTDCGYQAFGTDILAYHSADTVDGVLSGWKNSNGHNLVLLNQIANAGGGAPYQKNYVAIGVARVWNGQLWYWAAYFGEAVEGGTPPTTGAPTATTAPNNPSSTPTTFPDTITPTTTPIPIPTNYIFSVKARLPGIGANEGAGQNNVPKNTVSGDIELKDAETNTPVSNSGGNFILNIQDFTYNFFWQNQIEAGSYNLKARLKNTLWKSIGLITLTGGGKLDLPQIDLVSGDLNQDNILDLADYNAILACYGTKSCSNKDLADFNMDNKVDEKDLNIFYDGLANRTGD